MAISLGIYPIFRQTHVKFFFHQLSLHLHHSVFPTWQILMLARLHLRSLPAFENMCSPRCVGEYTRRNNLMPIRPIMCLKRPHVKVWHIIIRSTLIITFTYIWTVNLPTKMDIFPQFTFTFSNCLWVLWGCTSSSYQPCGQGTLRFGISERFHLLR